MSEEEKIELIYTIYGYSDTLIKARRSLERTIREAEARIVSEILNSSIGVKLLDEIRRIVREEIRRGRRGGIHP